MMYAQDYDETYPMAWYGRVSTGTPGSYAQTAPGTPGEKFILLDPSGGGGAAGHWYTWMDLIYPYTKSVQVFTCPSYTRANYSGSPVPNYWMNGAYSNAAQTTLDSPVAGSFQSSKYGVSILGRGTPMSAVLRPVETVMTFEMSGTNSPYALRGSPAYPGRWSDEFVPHLEGGNVVFGDGHVKWKSLQTMVAETGPYTTGSETGCNLSTSPPTPASSAYCSRAWNPFIP